jgi:hypothetical protein
MAKRREMLEAKPDLEQWRQAMESYTADLAASGDYPHLAEQADGSPFADTNPDELNERLFEQGLDWLLAGIAASLAE